jgi:pimeloyl-ACP methyl ester carboxylesterase
MARMGAGFPTIRSCRALAVVALAALLGACAAAPVEPFNAPLPPGIDDGRARFTEIFCAVLETRGDSLPDGRPCSEALSKVSDGPPVPGAGSVDLGRSTTPYTAALVPGIGYACIESWLQPAADSHQHLAQHGFAAVVLSVDALSGSTHNAGQVRDALMAMAPPPGPPRIVLLGYSKGAADALEALATYPELAGRVAAFVGIAGAVGGSPLADDATQANADIFRHWPGAKCDPGDGGAVASLRTDMRRNWLASHPLPRSIRYYTLVALPEPERVSRALARPHAELAKIDPRNDGQVIYADQIVPGSTLLGFLNADHWAVVLPISRSHRLIGRTLVDHNDYPREALLEALLRYVAEDLAGGPG